MISILLDVLIGNNSGSTPVVAPTVQASAPSMAFVEDKAVGIRYTRGNGAGFIIVARSGGAVNANPSDNTTYTASSTFGSGTQIGSGNYVVYKGTRSLTTVLDYFVAISGLTENTTYHFKAFEYNGSPGNEKYLTTGSDNATSQATKKAVFQTAIAHYNFDFDRVTNAVPTLSTLSANTTPNLTYGAGKIRRAGVFNGSNTQVNFLDNNSFSFGNGTVDTAFSIAAWVNPTNFSSNRWIAAKRSSGGTSAEEYQVFINTSGAVIFSVFSGGGTSIFIGGATQGTLTAGVWSHIIATYDPAQSGINRMKIYINGVSQTLTNNSTGTYVAMNNTASPFSIGFGTAPNANSFLGSLTEVTVFGSTVSQSDVTYMYNSGTGIPFFYNFDNVTNYEHPLFIFATRERWMFGSDNNLLYWSNDHGLSWTSIAWGTQYSANVAVYDKWPGFAYIWDDGTLNFATHKVMYRSVDGLANLTSPAIKGRGYLWTGNDSDNFLFHTPVDPTKPGTYFLTGANAVPDYMYLPNGVEILYWGNYGNVQGGACPTVLWYSIDKGATIRAFYMYGQNLSQRDDGTDTGGTTGTILGNASNSVIVRHSHNLYADPLNPTSPIAETGDFTNQATWIRQDYDYQNDTWSNANLILNEGPTTRWMAVALNYTGADVYWTSDAQSSADAAEKGIFKAAVANITEKISTRVLDLGDATIWSMRINFSNGKMLISGQHGNSNQLNTNLALVEDLGAGSVTYLPVTGMNSETGANLIGHRFYPQTAKGYVKVSVGGFRSQPGLSYMYKL